MKTYVVTQIAELIKKEPLPARLVAEADYLDLKEKFDKAKWCLKLALKSCNPNGILAEDIKELLKGG